MGILLYKKNAPLHWVTIGGVGLLLVFIALGQKIPIHLTQREWQLVILVYCFAASIIPMWILLQPRGYLGGFVLYASLIAGVVGFAFYNEPITAPAVSETMHWQLLPLGAGFFPLMFTTIACGACSGFHGLVSAGTTSRQLDRETDARIVGYGGMLLEGFVALVALATVMVFVSKGSVGAGTPDEIYARGLAAFLQLVGIPFVLGISFAKLAFATFIYDTLDVATRLGRYLFQELTGMTGTAGKYIGTLLTVLVPGIVLFGVPEGGDPAWKSYWPLFGTSNQLLACLTLAAVSVWLKHEKRNFWVTLVPCVFMAAVTLTSLFALNKKWIDAGLGITTVSAATALLMVLAVVLLGVSARYFVKPRGAVS